MKTLRQNGIEVTALHSHMVDETPRLYFMHFWANDDAQQARARRARGAGCHELETQFLSRRVRRSA